MVELAARGSVVAAERGCGSILPVDVRDLTFVAGGVRIIDSATFTLRAGGCAAIMGYNGAGKSVLLRLLHGLLTPAAGRIVWAEPLSSRALIRRQAMVFQHPVVLRRSVADNVRYAMRAQRVARAEQAIRLPQLLAAGELTHLAERDATVLSGGERQRLALVRALATEPEVLFLDEPTASLDPASAQTVERLIRSARDAGTKIVLVTQSVAQARRLATEVIFLHQGRVLEHQDAARFFAGPDSAPARAFVDGRLDL